MLLQVTLHLSREYIYIIISSPTPLTPRNALSTNMWQVEASPRYLPRGFVGWRGCKKHTCDDLICFFLFDGIWSVRNAQQANDIYDSGMLFLRTHVLLTHLSQRLGPSTQKFEQVIQWMFPRPRRFCLLQVWPIVLGFNPKTTWTSGAKF